MSKALDIKIGDKVICIVSGVKGVVVKKYFPTACEEQTMIRCNDGRLYHAPTSMYRKVCENSIFEIDKENKYIQDLIQAGLVEKV